MCQQTHRVSSLARDSGQTRASDLELPRCQRRLARLLPKSTNFSSRGRSDTSTAKPTAACPTEGHPAGTPRAAPHPRGQLLNLSPASCGLPTTPNTAAPSRRGHREPGRLREALPHCPPPAPSPSSRLPECGKGKERPHLPITATCEDSMPVGDAPSSSRHHRPRRRL